MEDVIISSVTPSGLGSGDSMEHVTLNFSKIKMTYTPQKQDGTRGNAVDFGWDVNANKQF